MAALAAAAILLTVIGARTPFPPIGYWASFITWLFAIAVLALAFVLIPLLRVASFEPGQWRSFQNEIALVICLTLIAFALRAFDLQNIPYPMAGDEASIGLEGQRILSGQSTNMFVTGWQSEPSLSFLIWAVSMGIFGQGIVGLRIASALIGAITVPALYILAKSMFNKQVAIVSAALLAVMSVHIHFSRIAVNNIENPILACLVFWLVYQATRTRRSFWFGAAGIGAGVTLYSFVGSRLVLILAFVFMAYSLATMRPFFREWRNFLVFALCAGLVATPLAIYFLEHPDIGFARMNQVGIVQSGWLTKHVAETGQPGIAFLITNLANSFLIFVKAPAFSGFYNSPEALYDPFWSFFFVLGLVSSLLHILEPRHLLLQLWFWGVLVFGGALIVPPPFAERFAMAFPAVAILAGYAIWKVAEVASNWNKQLRPAIPGFLGASMILLAASSTSFYFIQYTPKHYYTDPNSEVGVELGQYLGTAPQGAHVYFLGLPRMFYDFPSITFLSKRLEGSDVKPGDSIRDIVQPDKEAIFVSLPNRSEEMAEIRAMFPGGSYLEVKRRTVPDETLFAVYGVNLADGGTNGAAAPGSDGG